MIDCLKGYKREKDETQREQGGFVYANAPFLVYWEITRACDLACRHCRADALKSRDVLELSTSEGRDLLEAMRGFSPRIPHLVVTGGDPLKRADVFELLEHAVGIGFRVSVAPSVTSRLTPKVLRRFKKIGVESLALSLDGATAARHDGLRAIPGCFSRTLEAARLVLDAGIALQINTLVTADTFQDLPGIYRLLSQLFLMRWKLFALIAVGRGQVLREITPAQCETLHHWLYGLSKIAPFAVATTEAPHFRRVAFTKMRGEGMPVAKIRETSSGRGFGIRDGNGIMFISHTGDVYPSGFLPLQAGRVQTESVVEIYRQSEVFRAIRQTAMYKGRCGRCEFKAICGGSRARAYAKYGDPLESDPLCVYEPN